MVIAAFRAVAEAHQARAALESSGIGANVVARDESLERLCADVFDDGFDVVVDEDDADPAIALVQTMWHENAIDIAKSASCPECGSLSVATIPRLWIFVIGAVVLYVTGLLVDQIELFSVVIGVVALVLLITPNRRCRECGARWANPRPGELGL